MPCWAPLFRIAVGRVEFKEGARESRSKLDLFFDRKQINRPTITEHILAATVAGPGDIYK